jgi:NDP-sugar pyrophosphorylase family protein
VAGFLRESDPCLLLAGDMLLDADLAKLVDLHGARGDAVTFLLKEDRRAPLFGTIGVDAHGRVRRVGRHFDLGGEVRAGVYAHATVLSARALGTLPDREAFNHLTDWIVPLLAEGARDVRAEVLSEEECCWEPVGTPAEYLAANLDFPRLSYADADEIARETGTRCDGDVVVGSGASLGQGVKLSRVVVWDGERVPDGLRARDGVFAGGRFHPCAVPPGGAA